METQEATTIIEDQLTNDQINNDFYIVGLLKFTILFLCTFGLYMTYWFYQNWKQQKSTTGEDCWPIMRGIFLIFFTHELFTRIDKKLRLTEKAYDWSSQNTATLIIVFIIASRILEKLSDKNIGSPYTGLAALILIPIIGILLLYVQRIINFACNDSKGESNNQLTGLNYLWISIGVIFMLLVTIGTFLPESQ